MPTHAFRVTTQLYLLAMLLGLGLGCTLPCEEGGQELKVFQNGQELENGSQLVVGEVMVGGPQGGSHLATGVSFNTRLWGTTRGQFTSLHVRLLEGDEEIGDTFWGSNLDPETCQTEEAMWQLFQKIEIYNVESLLDLDGLSVRLEATLDAGEILKKEYELTLFVE